MSRRRSYPRQARLGPALVPEKHEVGVLDAGGVLGEDELLLATGRDLGQVLRALHGQDGAGSRELACERPLPVGVGRLRELEAALQREAGLLLQPAQALGGHL